MKEFLFTVPVKNMECNYYIIDAYGRYVVSFNNDTAMLTDDFSGSYSEPLKFYHESSAHEFALELQVRTGYWFGVEERW